MLPAELALPVFELLPELLELLGVFKGIRDAFLSLGRRIAAGLRSLRLGWLDASVLDAAAQLVDGQADSALPVGNGVKIGAVGVVR